MRYFVLVYVQKCIKQLFVNADVIFFRYDGDEQNNDPVFLRFI